MDVKILNNDISTTPDANTTYIHSIQELAQRIKIACTVSKGSFVYDPNFGRSDVDITNDDMLKKRLEMVFREATVDIPYTSLTVVDTTFSDNVLTATIQVTDNTDSILTEVTING